MKRIKKHDDPVAMAHMGKKHHSEGDLIYVWRQPKVGQGKWVGPGVVILSTESGAWVNMKGSLWRCANCQMRSATREESQGVEMVNRYLGDMKADINKTRGARKFVDVAKEGMPRFDDHDDQDDDEAPARAEDDNLDTIAEGNEEEPDEPEPVDTPSAPPSMPSTAARPSGRKAARHEHSTDAGSESREPSREPLSEPRGEVGTPAGPPATSRGTWQARTGYALPSQPRRRFSILH
mgnify:CR=1 FL=1